MLLDSNIIIATRILPITDVIAQRAIALRQMRRLSLGDALIAGTALAFDLILVTHNTSDFDWISDLRLFNPLVQG
jgi:hypothetical protein